ncbi:protein white-like [Glandiceps talaboti]
MYGGEQTPLLGDREHDDTLTDYNVIDGPETDWKNVFDDKESDLETSGSTIRKDAGVTLTWQDVKVSIPAENKRTFWGTKRKEFSLPPKTILKGVSGYVQPGSLTAILGSSGAGKSTLLNVLTFHYHGNLTVDGQVRLNGELLDDSMSSLMAYVPQFDLCYGLLTVREHLTFQALVRMDKFVSAKDRMARVEEVMEELNLQKCGDSRIGQVTWTYGISGGERKRLAVASELLTNPPLFILDEPTSGLDSSMAETVVSKLQELALKGHTVLCTVHQPSSELNGLIDSIYLMAEGQCAYFGHTMNAMNHFNAQGYNCPENFTPTDHYLMILSIRPETEGEDLDRVQELCDIYATSAYAETAANVIASVPHKDQDKVEFRGSEETEVRRSRYKNTWWAQFTALLWRSWLVTSREPIVTRARLGGAMKGGTSRRQFKFHTVEKMNCCHVLWIVFLAVTTGMIYFQTDYNQTGVQGLNGALFGMMWAGSSEAFGPILRAFQDELPIFRKENHNGMYRLDAFFLAKTIAQLPVFFVSAISYVIMVYWMAGLNPLVERFFIALLIGCMVADAAVACGTAISCCCPSIYVASTMAVLLSVPIFTLGGFYMNVQSIPWYLKWIEYLSYYRYGYEALMINQWHGIDDIECDFNFTARCIQNGEEILVMYGFPNNMEKIIIDGAALLCLLIGFRILGLVVLVVRCRRPKPKSLKTSSSTDRVQWKNDRLTSSNVLFTSSEHS